MNRMALTFTITIAIVLILLIFWRSAEPVAPSVEIPGDGTTVPAPAASSITLDGRRWSLQDQRGKVVLLDFWATWCGPCVRSIPHIKEIHDQFKSHSDFLLVGVSWDRERADLESFVRQRELPWLQLLDEAGGGDVRRKFGVTQIPTTFLIDRKGNIAAKDLAPVELVKEIERLLNAPE